MVFRFPVRLTLILLGICCCMIGAITNFGDSKQALSDSTAVKRTLIIDPGHGGADGGAIGADGTVESGINLEIALKLEAISRLCGVPFIMTRSTEELHYPSDANTIAEKKLSDQKARLRLIRDCPYGILFSIHQNSYPSEKVSGIQVLYGHSEESESLGILMQEQMNNALKPSAPRAASEISNDIYLLRNSSCTAVLIECGFISNPSECKALQNETYQTKLAASMLASYLYFVTI